MFTISPGLNGGRPRYGHPSQRKASPSAQEPHDPPVFPGTVKSISSSKLRVTTVDACFASWASCSWSSSSLRPQVQSLQALRRFLEPGSGAHCGGMEIGLEREESRREFSSTRSKSSSSRSLRSSSESLTGVELLEDGRDRLNSGSRLEVPLGLAEAGFLEMEATDEPASGLL